MSKNYTSANKTTLFEVKNSKTTLVWGIYTVWVFLPSMKSTQVRGFYTV